MKYNSKMHEYANKMEGMGDGYVYPSDIVHLIVRWKWLSLSGIAFPFLLAAVFLIVTPPVYKGKIKLKMDKIQGIGWMETPQNLKERLKAEGKDVLVGNDGMIYIYARANSESQVYTCLDEIADSLLGVHEVKYDGVKARLLKEIEVYNKKISLIDQAITELKVRLDRLKLGLKNLRGGSEIIKENEMSRQLLKLNERHIDLCRSREKIQGQIDSVKQARTRIFETAKTPRKIYPMPRRYFSLALVFGLMLGIVGPMIAEFVAKSRFRTSQEGLSKTEGKE